LIELGPSKIRVGKVVILRLSTTSQKENNDQQTLHLNYLLLRFPYGGTIAEQLGCGKEKSQAYSPNWVVGKRGALRILY